MLSLISDRVEAGCFNYHTLILSNSNGICIYITANAGWDACPGFVVLEDATGVPPAAARYTLIGFVMFMP